MLLNTPTQNKHSSLRENFEHRRESVSVLRSHLRDRVDIP
jgi:hypothetical protein